MAHDVHLNIPLSCRQRVLDHGIVYCGCAVLIVDSTTGKWVIPYLFVIEGLYTRYQDFAGVQFPTVLLSKS